MVRRFNNRVIFFKKSTEFSTFHTLSKKQTKLFFFSLASSEAHTPVSNHALCSMPELPKKFLIASSPFSIVPAKFNFLYSPTNLISF